MRETKLLKHLLIYNIREMTKIFLEVLLELEEKI